MATVLHDRRQVRGFQTGVSLHSHTLHSKEPLSFIYRVTCSNAILRSAFDLVRAYYRRKRGAEIDPEKAYWTPPLTPAHALKLEAGQIANGLGLRPLVSLTDHDDIDGPLSLSALRPDIPLSFEWSVPWQGTIFHIGVHNLPAHRVTELTERLLALKEPIGDLLRELAALPDTLIVFNHPLWDECGAGTRFHRRRAVEFLRQYRPYLHAIEVNGMRKWSENRLVLQLGESVGIPVVAGGDRHTCHANEVLNLTSASTFAEFVEEVRAGHSTMLLTDDYREPRFVRTLQEIHDVFATHEDHGRGWRRWDQRMFYQCADGKVRSFAELWDRPPAILAALAATMRSVRHPALNRALRGMRLDLISSAS